MESRRCSEAEARKTRFEEFGPYWWDWIFSCAVLGIGFDLSLFLRKLRKELLEAFFEPKSQCAFCAKTGEAGFFAV
jgi:hypothetical protein